MQVKTSSDRLLGYHSIISNLLSIEDVVVIRQMQDAEMAASLIEANAVDL